MSRLPVFALAVLLAVAAAWAYTPSLRGVLVLDDVRAIARNRTITTLWPLSTPLSPPSASTVAGRPIANLSFAVNYALSPVDVRDVFEPEGGDAAAGAAARFLRNLRGYHIFNLLIHVAAGLALFGIVRRTLLTRRMRARFAASAALIAFAVAIIWLLHPLQTAAVTYVVQRVESLMGLFFLLTMYCAIRAADGGRARVWAAPAVACCALGMATKEVMAAAPLVVALWDWLFSERDTHRVRWALFGALASTWVILAALLFHEHRGPSIDLSPGIVWRYALTQTDVMTHYLRLAFVPSPLVFLYDWPLTVSLRAVAAPAAFVVALAAMTVFGVIRRAACGFAGAWFFLTLAPTSSVLPIVTEVAAEHRMYLPLAAIVACAVVGGWLGTKVLLSRLVRDPRRRARVVTGVAAVLTAAVAIACGLGTRARNEDYASGERLWRDTVEKQPANQRARVALGEVLARSGRYAESEAQLRRAVDLAQADPVARVRLGSVVAAQGRLDEAIQQWELALGSRPDDADAHRFLGRAYAMRGQDSLAVGHLERLLETRKDDPAIFEELAAILANSADVEVRNGAKAVAAAERAVQLTGRQDARALEILAVAQSVEGRPSEAVSAAREALRIARAQGDLARIAELENRVKFLESRAPTQPPR